MPIRDFDWRDLTGLLSARHDFLFLFNERQLTSGAFRLFESAFSSLVPVPGMVTLTASGNGGEKSLYAQIVVRPGEDFAYLSFLAPGSLLLESLSASGFAALLEAVACIAGENGALRLLADVDEHSPAFELLRCQGFSVHSRQRMWYLPAHREGIQTTKTWRRAAGEDWIAIQSLYNNLVPALIQKTGADLCTKPRGMVCFQGGELAAYIELRYGVGGICAYPFVHPDAVEVAGELGAALAQLPGMPPRRSRPVYVCVSHYQSWLEPALEEQGALPGERMLLMAKYLSARIKPLPVLAIPVMDKGGAKPIVFSQTGENGYETHHR